jgi:hypothetical protein
MSDPVKFSLKLREELVVLEGADGKEQTYQVREMTGALKEEYLDENRDRLEMETDVAGKTTVKEIKTYKGIYASLLKRTLFGPGGFAVEEQINTFPHRVQSELYKIAQRLNDMDAKDENPSKN